MRENQFLMSENHDGTRNMIPYVIFDGAVMERQLRENRERNQRIRERGTR